MNSTKRISVLLLLSMLVGACSSTDTASEPSDTSSEESSTTETTEDLAEDPVDDGSEDPGVAPLDESLAACPSENIDANLIALVTLNEVVTNLSELSEYGGIVVVGPVEASQEATIRSSLGSIASTNPDAKLFVDEEGGAVQRLADVLGPIPAASEQTELADEALSDLWVEHNEKLADLGFTGNFGPVVDVGTSSGLDSRSFSSDPAVVVAKSEVFINAAEQVGIESVIKHFPGHGVVDVDTHESNAVTPTIRELEEIHIAPFADLVESRADQPIMISHLIVGDDAEAELPASISPTVYQYLESNFPEAPLYTDAFNMGAAMNTGAIEMGLAARAVELGADYAIVSLGGIQECDGSAGGRSIL